MLGVSWSLGGDVESSSAGRGGGGGGVIKKLEWKKAGIAIRTWLWNRH